MLPSSVQTTVHEGPNPAAGSPAGHETPQAKATGAYIPSTNTACQGTPAGQAETERVKEHLSLEWTWIKTQCLDPISDQLITVSGLGYRPECF